MTELAWVFITLGLFFTAVSGIGLLSMPSFFMKVQVVSKAATLGTIFCLIGVCLYLPTISVIIKSSLIVLFLLISTPTATHAMAQSARHIDYE